jgi:hypothetical protein
MLENTNRFQNKNQNKREEKNRKMAIKALDLSEQ